jgi:O-antigen ligase
MNMPFSELICKIRSYNLRDNILFVLYLGFIIGFFFCTDFKWHNNFFYACLLMPYLLTLGSCNLKVYLHSPMFLILITLISYLLLTPLWGEHGTYVAYSKIITRCLSLLVFIMLTTELALRYTRFIQTLILVICWASVIGGLLYIFTSGYEITIPPARLENSGNFKALRDSVLIGNAYGMVVLMLYFHLINHGSILERVGYFIFGLFCLAILVLTFSRGPIIAFYLAMFVGTLVVNDRKLLLIFMVITVLGWFFVLDTGTLHSMLFRGDSYRIELFQAAMDKIRTHFFLGHGVLATFSYPISDSGVLIGSPHNLYLSLWFYGGFIALSLLMLFIVRSVWLGLYLFLRYDNFIPGILVIYGLMCVITGSGKAINHPDPLYLYFWMPFGILMAYEIKDRTGKGIQAS